jgi:DNA-binding transcriptional ArsR family regulator
MGTLIPKHTMPPGYGRYANLLVTLGHPTRLNILEVLSKGSLHVNRILAEVKVERTLLSHHLRCLMKAGLIHSRREGKTIRYQLTPAIVQARESHQIESDCCEVRFEKQESATCNCHSFPLMVAILLLRMSAQIETRVRLGTHRAEL